MTDTTSTAAAPLLPSSAGTTSAPVQPPQEPLGEPKNQKLMALFTRILQPTTPLGNKAQGFFAGALFVYGMVVVGLKPDQIRDMLKTLLVFFLQ